MVYTAELSRKHPTCFIFLIDQSGSMAEIVDNNPNKKKAQIVADVINRLLMETAILCTKEDGIRDYIYVSVIRYGKSVGPAFADPLANMDLIPINEIANNPAEVVLRQKDDDAGGSVTIRFPVWFYPVAESYAPMCEAFTYAKNLLVNQWLPKHPESFPPIIFNISDGKSTDGNPFNLAEEIKNLATVDGNVLIFNVHISSNSPKLSIFPSKQDNLPDVYAKLLFSMSSNLTPEMQEFAKEIGYRDISNSSRGYANNEEIISLIRALPIGTRRSRLNVHHGKKFFVSLENGDVLTRKADVLVLKYAQASYGVDLQVLEKLQEAGSPELQNLPKTSQFWLFKSNKVVGTDYILFIGVEPLPIFGYDEIRQFARKSLSVLHQKASDTKEIIYTLHGTGYGLDEKEAFRSQIAGFTDAIHSGEYPQNLEKITIIEQNNPRYQRLNDLAKDIIPGGYIELPCDSDSVSLNMQLKKDIPSISEKNPKKQSIFIAMPFSDDMEDVYYYGIQNAVNAAGFLCERADASSFAGHIMEWVKKRIESSSLVIADLTKANPNVYLEVGYAWGCNKPTILVVQDEKDLHFDVKMQRCLIYKRIKDLEQSLEKELLYYRDHPEDFK